MFLMRERCSLAHRHILLFSRLILLTAVLSDWPSVILFIAIGQFENF